MNESNGTSGSTKKICIIGAGPVGISAARALARKGIDYDQLEGTDKIGGNWRHGVYNSAHIISSKKTTEFPDFPMPNDYPDFPSADQMLGYLESYANHFKLIEKISFNSKVEKVEPIENDLWAVTLSTGERRVYEGVIACNGHHWDRRWPTYDGHFDGEMIHSKDYQEPAQLKGKRVLVIGGGNSACDIVAEAARVGEEAHMSLRRGYWFLPKTFYGVPTAEMLDTWMPVWMQRIYLSLLLKVAVGKYSDYGLPEPDHKLFEHHPTINTEVLHYLKHGKVYAHPDIKRFSENNVEFLDGSKVEVDLVVCATGFHVSLPFLDPNIVEIDGSVVRVRWGVVAPRHKQLYIYGWAQARYGFGPLLTPASEMIAELILMQRKLTHPLGLVLEKMAQPLAHDHLLNPMDALKQVKAAKQMMWLLPIIDKRLGSSSSTGGAT